MHAHTGSVTLILRFGSGLNLNLHFYMLFVDGMYVDSAGLSDQQRTQFTPPYHGSAGQAAGFSLHAAVPLHHPPGRIRKAVATDESGQGLV